MQKELQTGSVKIPLATGFMMDGTKVKELTMREPTVDDQLNAQGTGTDAEQDLNLFANLCMVTPKDIRTLTMRDYGRVKKAYLGFLD